jgi:hypothetical protein
LFSVPCFYADQAHNSEPNSEFISEINSERVYSTWIDSSVALSASLTMDWKSARLEWARETGKKQGTAVEAGCPSPKLGSSSVWTNQAIILCYHKPPAEAKTFSRASDA